MRYLLYLDILFYGLCHIVYILNICTTYHRFQVCHTKVKIMLASAIFILCNFHIFSYIPTFLLSDNNIHNPTKSSYNFIWYLDIVRIRQVARLHIPSPQEYLCDNYHGRQQRVNSSLAFLSIVLLVSPSLFVLIGGCVGLHFLVALKALSRYL